MMKIGWPSAFRLRSSLWMAGIVLAAQLPAHAASIAPVPAEHGMAPFTQGVGKVRKGGAEWGRRHGRKARLTLYCTMGRVDRAHSALTITARGAAS